MTPVDFLKLEKEFKEKKKKSLSIINITKYEYNQQFLSDKAQAHIYSTENMDMQNRQL